MHHILLFNVDHTPYEFSELEETFRAQPTFTEVAYDDRAGSILQATFNDDESSTRIRLNELKDTISITGMTDTSLRAALTIQRSLGRPLQIIDTAYSFDLLLDGTMDLEQLNQAIADAQEE